MRGAEARALAIDGALGLSTGFRTRDSSFEKGRRVLKDVQLFEVSLVAIPANPQAKLVSVKSAVESGEITPRMIEQLLREGGLPQRFAKALLSGGWKAAARNDERPSRCAGRGRPCPRPSPKEAIKNGIRRTENRALNQHQNAVTEALQQTKDDVKALRDRADNIEARMNRPRVGGGGFEASGHTVPIIRKLRSLELLRAVAALLVVLFHVKGFGSRTGITPFAGIFSSGYRGVDLFFVLSGFIIAHVHARDIGCHRRIGNYLFNRFTRIYPALWIITLLAGVVYAFGFGGSEKANKLGGWNIIASFLLLPQANARGDALVNVSWTLKYEIFFYLVFAVLILNKRVGLALLGTWQAAVLAVSVWFSPEVLGPSEFYLSSLCLEFGVGLACAWLISRPGFITAVQGFAMQWVILIAGIVAFTGGMLVDNQTSFASVPCALGAGASIVGLTMLEQSVRIKVPKILVLLGGASYSIYLIHFSAISLLMIALTHVHFLVMNNAVFLMVAAFGIVAGVVFDKLVDQPIQRLLRQKLKPALRVG